MKWLGKSRLSLKQTKAMHFLLLFVSFEAVVVRILGAVIVVMSLGFVGVLALIFKRSDPKDTREMLSFAAMGIGTILIGEVIRWGVIKTRLWLARLAREA